MSKRTHMIWVMAIVLLAAGADTSTQTQNPEPEFTKLADAFAAAWGKGDAKAIAALHTKDAVRFSGTGEPAVAGTAAIEQALAGALGGPYKGTALVIKSNPSRRVAPDTYVGEGTYEVTGGSVPAGSPTRGQYMNVLVREGGRWRIAASAVMPVMPPK